MKSVAVGQVTPVVTVQELADWLAIDNTDPLIPVITTAATQAVINYLQLELVSRARTVTYTDWPMSGTNTEPSLSPVDQVYDKTITLPYANLVSIELVKVFGVDVTTYQIKAATPTQIRFDVPIGGTTDFDAIYVEYTAGFGVIADVPSDIIMATRMLAAFMFEHRGECDANEAIKRSGANIMLDPYKAYAVVL